MANSKPDRVFLLLLERGTSEGILKELIDFISHNPWFTLFGTLTIIQVAPIKIDPWKWILGFIKKALVGELQEKLEALTKDVEQEKVDNKRWNILDFANSCRNGRMHTKEEWNHCLSQLKEYESYCEEKDIDNGVIEEDAKYLRELYHERCIKNDFL